MNKLNNLNFENILNFKNKITKNNDIITILNTVSENIKGINKNSFTNVKTSFIYQDDVAEFLSKLLREKGIINLGGKTQFIYDFAKKSNK